MNQKLYRFFVICGIVGPIYFALTLLILGAMFPGYSHVHDYMSELGAVDSPVMLATNTLSFFLIGLFMFLYSFGIFEIFRGNRNGRIASMLIMIAGLIVTTIGMFPCDPGCYNFSPTGITHVWASMLPFAFFLPAFVLFAYEGFKGHVFDRKWAIFIIIITIISGITGAWHSEFEFGYGGLLQRMSYGFPLLFMLLSARHIYRIEFQQKRPL